MLLIGPMKIIAFYNIKGGVGKTATAVNLAYRAAQSGKKVLLWDLDPQAAASFYLRAPVQQRRGGAGALFRRRNALRDRIVSTAYEGLDLVPADYAHRHLDLLFDPRRAAEGRLRHALRGIERTYDYVFVDCAPSITPASEAVFHDADGIIVPTIPTPLSVRTLEQLVGHFREEGLDVRRLWPFFSMIDRRRKLHQELSERLPLKKAGFFSHAIPYASDVELMGVRRAPLLAYSKKNPAALAYEGLWDEVETRIKVRG